MAIRDFGSSGPMIPLQRVTGDIKLHQFLLQRLSMAMHRGNLASVRVLWATVPNQHVYVTNQLHSNFSCGFHNNYIHSYNLFPLKNTLLKLFIALECKYNKLQFGIRIGSIEASKQRLRVSTSCLSTTNLIEGNTSKSASFLKSEGI